jgi:hypothetical protein
MSTEQLHKATTTVAEHLSDKYAPINTHLVLAPFFENGWEVSRKREYLNRKGIGTQHYVLTHPDFLYPNGDNLTVEALNSNDGSKALMLMGGYGRVVCSNGLVIGDIESGRFIHRGTSIYEKLENKYDEIIGHLTKIKADVELLKNTTYTEEMIEQAVTNICLEVFGGETKKYSRQVIVSPRLFRAVTRIRREGDMGKDLFTALNVVQENIIRRGGLWVTVTTTNKETGEKTTEVKGKNASENRLSSVRLNKIISQSFLKVVA